RLTGEKWFCSAIDSAMAVALARPAGAADGSRTLVPFLVPRDQPGVPLHRATLGALEVDLAGAFALAAHAFDLLGRVELTGDRAAADRLRLVAPLAKLLTGKL